MDYEYITDFVASRILFTLGSDASIKVGAYAKGTSIELTRAMGASR